MKNLTLTLTFLLFTGLGFANNTDPIKTTTDKVEVAKLYTWEVQTVNGKASGVTYLIEDAKKAIKLMKTGDVIKSKIIETNPVFQKA